MFDEALLTCSIGTGTGDNSDFLLLSPLNSRKPFEYQSQNTQNRTLTQNMGTPEAQTPRRSEMDDDMAWALLMAEGSGAQTKLPVPFRS